jgi:chromosome segregation ATPase
MNAEAQTDNVPSVTPLDTDQAVAVVAEKSPAVLFANGEADRIFQAVKAWADPLVYDLNTEKGQRNLEGMVRKVAGVGNRLDEKVKAEIERLEATVKPYKQERARLKKLFDDYKAERRAPLLEAKNKEKAQADRKLQIQQDIAQVRSLGDPIQDGHELTVEELEHRIKEIDALEISKDDFAEFTQEAEQAKAVALRSANNALNAAKYLADKRAEEAAQQERQARKVPGDGPRSAKEVMQEVYPDEVPASATEAIPDGSIEPQSTPVSDYSDRFYREPIPSASDDDKKRMRQEALAAMMAFNFPQRANVADDVYEALCKQLIAGIHLGKVPHIQINY